MVGGQDIGSPGRPVSSGLQVPGEPGHCRARTKPPWWTSLGHFPSKCPSGAPAERVILSVDSLVLWKIISEEDDFLIPKKSGRVILPADFCTGNSLGRGEPLCSHSIDCCLVSGSQ